VCQIVEEFSLKDKVPHVVLATWNFRLVLGLVFVQSYVSR